MELEEGLQLKKNDLHGRGKGVGGGGGAASHKAIIALPNGQH